MASIDSIITVSISTNTANPSQAGFGTPGLLAYVPSSVFPARTKSYASLTEMTDDGHLTDDAAYLMAVALKAQNPSVTSWKVLRRALPASQTIRVTPTITTAGEVLSLTVEGTTISYTIPSGATVASICTAMAALFAAITGVSASDDTTHITLTPKNVASATLTVDTSVAGNYTVTLDGTAFTYAVTTETLTQIRDALQGLIVAGGYAASEVVDNGTDALDFSFASHAGADLRESVTGGGSMTLSSEVSAYRLLSIGLASAGLTVKDLTADPGVATDWAAIIAYDSAFYGVDIDSASEAQVNALAALIETQKMIAVHGTIDTENKDASTTTDLGSDLKAAAYDRTALLQCEVNSQYAGCRWMGKQLPKAPGSSNWAYKTLAGLTVSSLSAAEEGALDGKNINHYTAIKDVNVTRYGAAASGEFIDVVRGADWFQARLQERIYRLLITNEKIPYDKAGTMFHAEIYAQMVEAEKAGVLAPDTDDTPWVISIPSTISTADKASRNYSGIEFSAFLAGAVNTVQMVGTFSN